MEKKVIKIIKIILLLIVFVIMLGFLMPRFGRFDFNRYREDSLKTWQKQVLMYKNATGHLPHDLYEVYLFYRDEINLKDFPIESYRKLASHKKDLLKKNPAYFLELTDYEYVQDGQHWYVKEKNLSGSVEFSINEHGEIKKDYTEQDKSRDVPHNRER